MAFTTDSFTDTSNLALASHVGETGATWTRHPINASGDMRITNANRCRVATAASPLSLYYSSGVPLTADYNVQGTIRAVSVPGSGYAGLAGRVAAGTSDFVWIIYNLGAGQWQLWETAGGGSATIATYTQALTPSADYVVKLTMVGAAVTVTINGVDRITGITGVLAAGRAGLIGNGAWDDSTGLHFDDLSASDYRQLRVVGDSITNERNASDSAHAWGSLLAAALGYPKVGNPVNATQIADQCTVSVSSIRNQVYLPGVSSLDVWAWLTGYNDIRYFGTNANGLEAYTRILRAAIAWMSRAASDCYQTSNGAWTFTGTWTTFQAGSIATNRSSTTGDKASISVTGTAITVAYLSRWGLNDGATFTVKIDGVTVDTIDGNFGATSGFGDGSPSQFVMMAKRYGGLAAGAHTVELQSTTSGTLQPGFVTGNGEATAPEVRLCGPLKMTSTGAAANSPYDKASDAAVTAYANAIIGICRDAYTDGRNVKYANVNSYYSIAEVDVDDVHPGDPGHAHIKDAFMAAAPVPPGGVLLKLPPMSFRPAMNGNFQG